MVTLTRLLGALVGWVTATPRRLVSTLVVAVLAVVTLFGPVRHPDLNALSSDSGNSGGPRPSGTVPASGSTGPSSGGTAGRGGPVGSGLPTPSTVTIGPSDRPRAEPVLPAEAGAVATGYVQTVNSHDARPGHDRDFADSYRRARRYVTPQVYALVTAPNRRGDYQWTAWVAQRATVTVRVDRAAVPDGAPLPTPTTVYVRIRFTQTVNPGAPGVEPTSVSGEVTLITQRQHDGGWLVSQLLAA
ncbi:MAG TPA: hypothetical protein VIS06_02170 [Mycobacteriales bacterium]